MRYGYKASAEQFETRQLLEFALAAERSGLDAIAVSDHFQPWRHNGGHAPAASHPYYFNPPPTPLLSTLAHPVPLPAALR